MDVILSWILATALGLGMALLTAPRPMSAVNPGLLWSGPPRRPRTPWMITALLLFGLPCWIVGGLVGCAAHTVSGTWVEVQVRGGMEGAVHAWREVAKEVCDSPAPARPLRVASTGELGVEGSRTTTVSGEAMCGGQP